jgi:UDP-glucose-4-epimerase GalE
VLVTGGAGYVGSICTQHLCRAGWDVVVYDSLVAGHADAVTVELIEADVRDTHRLTHVLSSGFDAVVHLAAYISVAQSVSHPEEFHDINVGGTASLIQAMTDTGTRHAVFASSVSVYGNPGASAVDEDHAFDPASPYATTKVLGEQLLERAARDGLIHSARLRFANICGAADDGSLGERHDPETHLVPLALRAAAAGNRMTVHRASETTPDGTGVRDYVHVEDIASAIRTAIERLGEGHQGGAWNIGTGLGTTTLQIIEGAEQVVGAKIERSFAPPRAGDVPWLLADIQRAKADLRWSSQRTVAQAIASAHRWEQHLRSVLEPLSDQ